MSQAHTPFPCCEECNNLETKNCSFCAHPNYSRFSQRDSSVLIVYIAAAIMLAAVAVVVVIIAT